MRLTGATKPDTLAGQGDAVLDRLSKLLRGRRRRAEREPRSQQAYLFAGSAPLGPVRLADISATGVRVELLRPFAPDGATHLLIMDSSQLMTVEPAWSSASSAAFRITGSTHLRGYTEGEAEAIKAWWIAHRLGADE
jgi:hypothetical protein